MKQKQILARKLKIEKRTLVVFNQPLAVKLNDDDIASTGSPRCITKPTTSVISITVSQ
jgi:hypothetical protein